MGATVDTTGIDSAPTVGRVRLSWPRISVSASQLLLIAAVLGMAWRTITLSLQQTHSVVLPGAVLLAPASVGCVLLLHKMAVRSLPSDNETDLIVAFMFAVLGVWFLHWTPTRFGVTYWLWRPDLLALGLGSLALVALTLGSGAVLYLGPSVAAAALVMSPLCGLIVSQHSDGLAIVALVSAIAAVLPLLVSRPFSLRSRGVQLGLAIVGGIIGIVAAKAETLTPVNESVVAAAAALVLVEGWILWSALPRVQTPATASQAAEQLAAQRQPRGARGARMARFRLLTTVLLAVGFGLLDGLIPSFAGASGKSVKSLLTPTSDQLGQLSAPGGVQIAAWRQHDLGGASHALKSELITATGPSAAAVLTYPVQSLINFIGAPCPLTRNYAVDGRKVIATEYADNQGGATWDLYTWNWHSAQQFQRSTLVLAYGIEGHSSRLPSLIGASGADGINAVGLFVANRHIVCFNGPVNRQAGLAATSKLIASVS